MKMKSEVNNLISLKKKGLAILTAAILTASIVGCGLVEETPESIENTVLAEVNGIKITQKDLNEEAATYIESYKTNYGEEVFETEEGKETLKQLKIDILNGLVEMRIIDERVKESDIDTESEEVQKAVDERIAQVKASFESEEKYQEALTEAGFTDETYKVFVKEDHIRQTFQSELLEDVKATEEEAKAYYDANKAKYLDGAGAKIYHIYLGNDDAAKLAGEEALAKIKADDDYSFEDAVKEYSKDASAAEGGLLGDYTYDNDQFYPDFMEHVKVLEEGEISEVVKSTAGYHIIKVEDVHKEDVQKTYEDVKDDVMAKANQEKQVKFYEDSMKEWKEEYKVKIHEDKIK